MHSPIPNKSSNSIRPPSLPKSHTKSKPDALNSAHSKSFQSLKQVTPNRPLPGRRTSVVKTPGNTSAVKNGKTVEEPILIESLEATPNQELLTSQKKSVKYMTIEDTPENKDKVLINESFGASAISDKWNNDSVIEQDPSIIEDFIPPMTQEKHSKQSRTKENYSNLKVNKNLSLIPEGSSQESHSNNLPKNTLLANIIPEDEPSENKSPVQQAPSGFNYGFSISLSPSQQFQQYPNLNSTGKDTSRFGGSPELRSPVALDKPLNSSQDPQPEVENDAGSDATSNLLSHIDDYSLFPNEISFNDECENYQEIDRKNKKPSNQEVVIIEKPSMIPGPEDLRCMGQSNKSAETTSVSEDAKKAKEAAEKDMNSSSLFDLSQNFLETKKPAVIEVEEYKPDPFGGIEEEVVIIEEKTKPLGNNNNNQKSKKMEIEPQKETKKVHSIITGAGVVKMNGKVNKENKEKKPSGQSILKPNEAYKYFDRKLQKAPQEERQKAVASVDSKQQQARPSVEKGRLSHGKPLLEVKSIVNKPIMNPTTPKSMSSLNKSSFGSVPKGFQRSAQKSPGLGTPSHLKSTLDKNKAVSSLNKGLMSNGKRGFEELQPSNQGNDEKYQNMKKLKNNEGNVEIMSNTSKVSRLQADPLRTSRESVNSKQSASHSDEINQNMLKTNGMKNGKNCVYCGMELESKTGNKMLSCLHKAHMNCFTTLERRKKASCPLCNSNMSPMSFNTGIATGVRPAACKF